MKSLRREYYRLIWIYVLSTLISIILVGSLFWQLLQKNIEISVNNEFKTIFHSFNLQLNDVGNLLNAQSGYSTQLAYYYDQVNGAIKSDEFSRNMRKQLSDIGRNLYGITDRVDYFAVIHEDGQILAEFNKLGETPQEYLKNIANTDFFNKVKTSNTFMYEQDGINYLYVAKELSHAKSPTQPKKHYLLCRHRAFDIDGLNDAKNVLLSSLKNSFPLFKIEFKNSMICIQHNNIPLNHDDSCKYLSDKKYLVFSDANDGVGLKFHLLISKQEITLYNLKVSLVLVLIFFIPVGLLLYLVYTQFHVILLSFSKVKQQIQIISNNNILNNHIIKEQFYHQDFEEVVSCFNYLTGSLYQQSKKAEDNAKLAAIAQTTQMLAHDVRKPFSILKISLELLSKVSSMGEFKRVLGEISLEVDRAMTSVNGMINDVMEIGRTAAPIPEPVSVESLIEASLNEIVRMHAESSIIFNYELKHTHMLLVDPLKVGRVFSNILGNAIQAMKGKGHIWIKTVEGDGMITFCLGNDGSFIDANDLGQLFGAFFTKNKKGGTGLGLAIAQKAVQAHGGRIWCESSIERKNVEFFFSLPVCNDMLSQSTAQLPESSMVILEKYQISLTQMTSGTSINESASTSVSGEQLEKDISLYAKGICRPLTMAIIDDEAIYRNALMGLINGTEGIKDAVVVDMYSNSNQLFDAFTLKKYDFLICDIDLGPDSQNGYDIVKTLRQNGCKTAVCIHSNRALPEDYAHAVEVGAQAFLPKPLSRFHLLKFMSGIIDREKSPLDGDKLKVNEGAGIPPLEQIDRADSSSKSDTVDHIIYVDDDKVYRTYAPSTISDARVTTYRTPEEVIAEIANDQNFLSGLSAIITDQYFGKLSNTTGLEFAATLRNKYGFKKPIIINSNEEFTFEDLKGKADLCLPKKLSTWADIKKMLPINPDDSKKPQLIIERKSHSELTELERVSFSKLRHNVRGALGGIELIIVNMQPNETRGDFSEKFEAISEYFSQITPYFPGELITEIRTLFEKLETASHDNVSDFMQIYTGIKASLEKLKHHHYTDDWWQFDPQEEARKAELARMKALIENPINEVVINMENKELQQRIVTYAAEHLDTTIIVTNEAESLAPILITDSFEICSAALDFESDVLMVEDDAAFEMIIKKLTYKLEMRLRQKNPEQINV